MAENNEDIIWRAAEFKYFKKSFGWYVTVIGIAALLVIFALTQNNFFFAVFIVLATIMLVFLGKKRPKVVRFEITDNGVSVGKDISYSYDELEGYTVREYEHRLSEIVIKRNAVVDPFLKMPVDSKKLPKAVDKLSKHIPEKEYEESMIDTLSDLFGF